VHHARDGRLRTRPDIGRGARNRSGGREAAEQRRTEVGDALPDQFLVRTMPRTGCPSSEHLAQIAA